MDGSLCMLLWDDGLLFVGESESEDTGQALYPEPVEGRRLRLSRATQYLSLYPDERLKDGG